MNLELTPNEYLNTSRDVYETAYAYQSAMQQGRQDARDAAERKRKQAANEAESLARLRARAG